MKGILFKPWKIKTIAANTDKEWQTRRAGGLDVLNRKTDFADQPNSPDEYSLLNFDGKVADFSRYAGSHGGMSVGIIYHLKPRYLPGEVVYIKEAHATEKAWDDKPLSFLSNAGDVPLWYQINDPLVSDFVPRGKWRNPRTMPAWAARYFIKITRVEACRTKDITPEDCSAEGIIPLHLPHMTLGSVKAYSWEVYPTPNIFDSPRLAYFALYDSINGKGAHERNWDWKYSFIKVDKPSRKLRTAREIIDHMPVIDDPIISGALRNVGL